MTDSQKVVSGLETIDKDVARLYLEKNAKNRKINDKRVAKYLRDMNAGNWKVVPDAIGFNKKGHLTNGQHRLRAFLKSELNTIEFIVTRGLEEDAFDVTDDGKPRNAKDTLGILGYSNPRHLATTARYMYAFDTFGVSESSMGLRFQIGNNDIVDTVEKHTGLVKCVNKIHEWKKGKRLIPESYFLGFAFYIYSSVGKSARESRGVYTQQVITGVNLTQDDPAYVLREKLFSDQQSKNPMIRLERCAIILKGFNSYMKGEKIKRLNWGYKNKKRPEAFPKFILKSDIK